MVNVDPGCEAAALKAIAKHFADRSECREHARVAWAAMHGLVSLEQLGLIPADTDHDSGLLSVWLTPIRLLLVSKREG